MASGFVDRFKGKLALAIGDTWVAGIQVNASGLDQNTSVGWGVVNTSTASPRVTLSTARVGGVEVFAPGGSTAAGGTILQVPIPVPGAIKILNISTLNGSTIMFVTLNSAAANAAGTGPIVFAGIGSSGSTASFAGTGGSTISNTFKSTQSCQVELIAMSTFQWLFASIVPSTTGHLTFSTST